MVVGGDWVVCLLPLEARGLRAESLALGDFFYNFSNCFTFKQYLTNQKHLKSDLIVLNRIMKCKIGSIHTNLTKCGVTFSSRRGISYIQPPVATPLADSIFRCSILPDKLLLQRSRSPDLLLVPMFWSLVIFVSETVLFFKTLFIWLMSVSFEPIHVT